MPQFPFFFFRCLIFHRRYFSYLVTTAVCSRIHLFLFPPFRLSRNPEKRNSKAKKKLILLPPPTFRYRLIFQIGRECPERKTFTLFRLFFYALSFVRVFSFVIFYLIQRRLRVAYRAQKLSSGPPVHRSLLRVAAIKSRRRFFPYLGVTNGHNLHFVVFPCRLSAHFAGVLDAAGR